MRRRFRTREFGEYQELDLTKGNIGTVMVSDAEVKGLVQYLNNARSERDKKIKWILEQMLELEKMKRPVWGETRAETQVATMVAGKAGRTVPNPILRKIAPEKYWQELAITEKSHQINEELCRYRYLPNALSLSQEQWVVVWQVVGSSQQKLTLHEGVLRMNDGTALRMILDLARAASLSRLRRCLNCQKWLYAKFRHQGFCTTKCQQFHYAKSEEWKAKRRKYMRGYRARTTSKVF